MAMCDAATTPALAGKGMPKHLEEGVPCATLQADMYYYADTETTFLMYGVAEYKFGMDGGGECVSFFSLINISRGSFISRNSVQCTSICAVCT